MPVLPLFVLSLVDPDRSTWSSVSSITSDVTIPRVRQQQQKQKQTQHPQECCSATNVPDNEDNENNNEHSNDQAGQRSSDPEFPSLSESSISSDDTVVSGLIHHDSNSSSSGSSICSSAVDGKDIPSLSGNNTEPVLLKKFKKKKQATIKKHVKFARRSEYTYIEPVDWTHLDPPIQADELFYTPTNYEIMRGECAWTLRLMLMMSKEKESYHNKKKKFVGVVENDDHHQDGNLSSGDNVPNKNNKKKKKKINGGGDDDTAASFFDDEMNQLCTRGLEGQTPEATKKRWMGHARQIRAVLLEQDRQKMQIQHSRLSLFYRRRWMQHATKEQRQEEQDSTDESDTIGVGGNTLGQTDRKSHSFRKGSINVGDSGKVKDDDDNSRMQRLADASREQSFVDVSDAYRLAREDAECAQSIYYDSVHQRSPMHKATGRNDIDQRQPTTTNDPTTTTSSAPLDDVTINDGVENNNDSNENDPIDEWFSEHTDDIDKLTRLTSPVSPDCENQNKFNDPTDSTDGTMTIISKTVAVPGNSKNESGDRNAKFFIGCNHGHPFWWDTSTDDIGKEGNNDDLGELGPNPADDFCQYDSNITILDAFPSPIQILHNLFRPRSCWDA